MPIENINQIITGKSKEAVKALQDEQRKLGMKHGPDPLTKITTRLPRNAGVINRITFKFKQSGIFVHKGVGRGTKINQVGTTNRKPKEWFNPVIEKFADEIIEEVADEWVDVVFEKLKIK